MTFNVYFVFQEEEERQQEKATANLYDDKVIKEMERKLKLNKRKKDTLPKAFMDDGLDCILCLYG